VELHQFESLAVAVGGDLGEQVNHAISQRRQHLRRAARPHPSCVFPQGFVADPVQAVFNTPVLARESEKAFRCPSVAGQTCDAGDFDGSMAAKLSFAGQTNAELQAFPRLVDGERGRDFQGAAFAAAVPFLLVPKLGSGTPSAKLCFA